MIINLAKINFGGVKGGGGPVKPEEVFNAYPTIEDQIITPSPGAVFSSGTVHAVTADIDENIKAENIKKGVTILGVKGENVGELTSLDVVPTSSRQEFDPADFHVDGFSPVTVLGYNVDPIYESIVDLNIGEVKPIPGVYQEIEVAPTTTTEVYTAEEGFDAISKVTVDAVTAEIDTNIVADNIKKGVTILGVEGNLEGGGKVSVKDNGLKFGNSDFTTVPDIFDFTGVTDTSDMFDSCSSLTTVPQLDTSNVIDMTRMFNGCYALTSIPQLNTSKVTGMMGTFQGCSRPTTIPQLDTSKVTNMMYMFSSCSNLTTVEGIDFSGLTSNLTYLFGFDSTKSKVTRFIVNGKLNVSISDNYSIKALTAIDYDSVKSILVAASKTDNTNAKELAFNRTISDPTGELQNIITICSGRGWTITGLTLN